MRKERRELEYQKCLLLTRLGFDIGHGDASVYLNRIEFDFSAVAGTEVDIINHAVKIAFESGKRAGREQLQEGIRGLLGMGD